jgi:phage gpG-like protein
MDICAQILSGGVSDMYDSSGHGAWPELAESTKAARRGASQREQAAAAWDDTIASLQQSLTRRMTQGRRNKVVGKLARARVAQSKARKGGDKPLVDSGVLSGSTEAASGTDWAMASTGQDYIKYHLDGGPIIPRRNPFDLPDEVIDECVDAILAHIAEEP